MGRKANLRQVDEVCRHHRMTPDQDRRFRRLLHELKKSGHGGTANGRGDFTRQELHDLASEFVAEE